MICPIRACNTFLFSGPSLKDVMTLLSLHDLAISTLTWQEAVRCLGTDGNKTPFWMDHDTSAQKPIGETQTLQRTQSQVMCCSAFLLSFSLINHKDDDRDGVI